MAIYGLSVFLETPKSLRKGRTRYIILSFVITGLKVLSTSLDGMLLYIALSEATPGYNWFTTIVKYLRTWYRFLAVSAFYAVIIIGDALLVGEY